jgi:drug/metabolite transporter (DMT)-like permease
VILLLARAVLQERLSRLQMAGAMIALAGFFATVMSGSFSIELVIVLGDIEAILSAAAFGSGIIFISKLTKGYPALSVTGSTRCLAGLILAVTLWVGDHHSNSYIIRVGGSIALFHPSIVGSPNLRNGFRKDWRFPYIYYRLIFYTADYRLPARPALGRS